MVDGLHSYPLLAIPLFILSGIIMARGGLAQKLFEFFAFFMGRFTAGLPITAIVTCLFYGTLSGSGPATTAAVGSMVVPYLQSMGYPKNFSAAVVTTAGSLGVIIPPSVPFIIYALVANVSVAEMFLAGIIPGFIVASFLSICAYGYCKKYGEDKVKLEANYTALKMRGFFRLFKESFWALLTPVIILGGIYGGVFTPTEAATVSVVYSIFISMVIYKTITIKEIFGILSESTRAIAPLLVVIAAATLFGRVITLLQLPSMLSSIISEVMVPGFVIILFINLLLLIAGMFINVLSAILILTPVLSPIAISIGMDPIHFGIMMVVNLSIGLVTPPVGADLFVTCSMFHIPIATLTKYVLPFIISFIFALIIISYVPQVSLLFIR
jgi:C4-dicarboxylate transporter DctM subunit